MSNSSLYSWLAAISLLGIFGAGCSKPHAKMELSPPGLPAAKVRLATVETGLQSATEEVVGTVRSRLRASVEAKISGRVERMEVAPGQSVKAGDLLALLDAREIKSRLDQAIAQRDQAVQDLQRYPTLLKEAAVTKAEFEAVQTRHRVAAAAVEEAETMLGYARVVAPFTGVITRKILDVGDLATPGRPILEMEDMTHLRFEADVPEALLEQFQVGSSLRVDIAAAGVNTNGTVSEISPSASPLSRTYLVKLDLSPAPRLRSGQFGRVAVPLGTNSIPIVPASAVIKRGQLEQVFVVDGSRTHLRIVKTGKVAGDQVELLAGVERGEKVVAANAHELVDHQPVEVQP